MKLGNLNVKFEHLKLETGTDSKGRVINVPFATTARVFDGEGKLLTMGTAQCGAKDLYKKEIGRKISLSRAINSLSLQKEERTKIWRDYHERKVNISSGSGAISKKL